MSAFKRYQSRVFWGHMEARDNPAFQNDDVDDEEEYPAEEYPGEYQEQEEQVRELELGDDEESSAGSGPENTTVIRICPEKEPPPRPASPAPPAATTVESDPAEMIKKEPTAVDLAMRSFSPASRGQRSQDSGFSDSSCDLDNATGVPTRHRRRRSSHRRPTRTSTPNPEADLSPEAAGAAEECLDDFLFEPTVDELDHSSIYPETAREPVRLWLGELRGDVEDECMATLQSKSLPRRRLRDDEPESRDLRLLTASATGAAKKVVDAAERFDERFQAAVRSINAPRNGVVDRDLLQSIEDEATAILVKYGGSMPRCLPSRADSTNLARQLGRLKSQVDRALSHRLDFYIEKVVRGLEEAPKENGSTARGALAALTALGLAGPRAASSIARCSGIRALLTSLVSAARLSSELRSCTLRALASVCCCVEAIDQLVREGGPEILVELLSREDTPHTEKSDAAALLVQITAPWMDYVGLPYIEPFALDFVDSITELAEKTTCKQTLLLAAAAINHLAHSRRCIAAIIKCDSIKKLLRCVKKSNGGNVCLMEQVASLIGLVARVPQARAHLVDTRASVALVCFLRMQPPGLEDEYRRLEKTAREALTRLCVDPEIAQQVVAVGGSNCLPSSDCSGRECQGALQTDGFKSTQSLRVARKIAAEQIDIARIKDHSPR